MINGNEFTFQNDSFNTLSEFIDKQVVATYYTIDPGNGIAIRTSNILKIEHLDINNGGDEKHG